MVPEVVEHHAYQSIRHRNTAGILRWLLMRQGTSGVAIVGTPFYLDEQPRRE